MAQLTINESAGSGFTHAFRFNWVDLNTTGFLATIDQANQRIIGSIPAGGIVDLVVVNNTIADAGATNLTLDVGVTASDPDEFIDNLDLDDVTRGAVNTGDALKQSTTGATLPIVGYHNNATTAKSIYMELNGTHANLTAGEWVIAWRQLDSNNV
jgi:hypothetical protein